ncbi:hypothetical protein [Streptomyces sp. NPDC089919]|uniref:hypothetical protein n=1 Tax=Streptomyces sp. NPDC089919 TaxID=3155188 RepID=UPI003426AC2F
MPRPSHFPVQALSPEPRAPQPSPDLYEWRFAEEGAVYLTAVDQVLTDPVVVSRLESRPEVTAGAVRTAMQARAAVERTLELAPRVHGLAGRTLERHRQLAAEIRDARSRLAQPQAAPDDPHGPLGALRTIGRLLSEQIVSVSIVLYAGLHLWALHLRGNRWLLRLADELSTGPVRQVTLEVIEALLGEDPRSVLVYDGYQGLRARRDARFFVQSACAGQLARKLALIDSGTIALSGPRGVGKTTLLNAASGLLRPDEPQDADGPDLVIHVAVPAAYTPYDFVLSALVGVTEEYLRRAGRPVPDFSRLSGFARLRQHAAGTVRRAGRWLLFALPALGLLVLGAAAGARAWWAEGYGPDFLLDTTQHAARPLAREATALWQGRWVLACAVAVSLGALLWGLRPAGLLHPYRRPVGIRRIGRVLVGALGFLLVLLAAATCVSEYAHLLRELFIPPPVRLGKYAVLVVCLPFFIPPFLLVSAMSEWPAVTPPWLLKNTAGAALCVALAWLTVDVTRPYVFDAQNPARLAVFVTGWALVAAAWRGPPGRRTGNQDLARRCLNQLYRLRTVQGTSATLNLAPAPLFGSAHASSLTSVAPNFPQLVAEFRDLVGAVAQELGDEPDPGRVFLCVDELDRMGTPEQARTFLAEIKAVLGVPKVYCLVSVAEDVSAGFVRRGMPHRDTTDSTFDDVVHVRPLTLAESKEVLDARVKGLPGPYAVLAHALSGGIPRDLIRYALGLVELRESTPYVELRDIALLMLAEELSDTLAGFRVLLAAHPWTPGSASVLLGYQLLTERLDAADPAGYDELVAALREFVTPAIGSPTEEPAAAARQTVDEGRAYAAYVLTLLEVFTPAGFEQRSEQVAARSPDGSGQRLADMRAQLAVSPYSALLLIGRVRRAWDLPELDPPGV